MRTSCVLQFVLAVTLSALLLSSCNEQKSSADTGKIPITTKSEEAKKEFLQGQDLSDRLLVQDAIAHFDKAVALDPTFASAELALANTAGTPGDFLNHLNKAVSLAGNASEGEQLLIAATEAGANGNAAAQKNDLEKLVAEYPKDERAQLSLGNYYFGVQDYAQAIAHYTAATEIAPTYSNAYNILGYAYRQTGDYASAEQTFKKYTEMIPNDPNPHDSYAELLMKMGRFDDSITQYRQALSVDSHFNPSRFGIAGDLMYQGKPDAATAALQEMADNARNDGELRTAYFGMAVVATDSGNVDKALQAIDKEYAVAEKKNDSASMSADLQAKGNILLDAGKYDEARRQFERSLQLLDSSNASQQIKDNAMLQQSFNLAAIALGKKDYAAAKKQADEYSQKAKNPFQIKQSHELAGRLALAHKDFDQAIAELEQSNLQDPRNLYRLGEACQAKGDSAQAKKYFDEAANFNSLPQLNYAFIRRKAEKMAGAKRS